MASLSLRVHLARLLDRLGSPVEHNGTPSLRRVLKEVPMPDFTVRSFGIDTSGRKILMTAYMADWWEQVVAALGFRPTIVQGAFMRRVGGGAVASAGYHDLGGCIDLRLWDLTPDQQDALNRQVRLHGAAGWRRDQQHGGMDEHYHLVLGTDRPLAAGAQIQWDQYLAGRDGLATNGPDYMWRPTPLVTTPPERDWFDMATEEDLRQIVREEIAAAFQADQKNGRTIRENLLLIAKKVGVKPVED